MAPYWNYTGTFKIKKNIIESSHDPQDYPNDEPNDYPNDYPSDCSSEYPNIIIPMMSPILDYPSD